MKVVLILAVLAAGLYYGVRPLIPWETCPVCEGRSAAANQAGSNTMNRMGVQTDPKVNCAYCGNTGKMSLREREKLLPQLEEIRKNQAASPP